MLRKKVDSNIILLWLEIYDYSEFKILIRSIVMTEKEKMIAGKI